MVGEPETKRCECHVLKINVGLDCGVTQSKYSIYLHTSCSLHLNTKINHLVAQDQIPTVLYVDPSAQPEKLIFANPPGGASADSQCLRYFKLALIKDDLSAEDSFNPHLLAIAQSHFEQRPVHDEVVELIRTFTEGLFAMALEKIKGYSLFQIYKTHSIQVVVTVPGCWSPKTIKELNDDLEDTYRRGIIHQHAQTIIYRTENMAAMRAVLSDFKPAVKDLIKEEQNFLVADCGGMTVDTAKYVHKGNPQHTNGPSRLVGSVLLDHMFETLLTEKVEQLVGQGKPKFSDDVRLDLASIIWEWDEQVRNSYNPTTLNEGGVTFKMRRTGKVVQFSRREMVKTFDFVIKDVARFIAHVCCSMEKDGGTPKVVFLTGGFTGQLRLRRFIQAELNSQLQAASPKVMSNDDSETTATAVCRGAVLFDVQPEWE